ncbi:hypothetical protein J6590_009342, partial [Homalodisca vitripennis]
LLDPSAKFLFLTTLVGPGPLLPYWATASLSPSVLLSRLQLLYWYCIWKLSSEHIFVS